MLKPENQMMRWGHILVVLIVLLHRSEGGAFADKPLPPLKLFLTNRYLSLPDGQIELTLSAQEAAGSGIEHVELAIDLPPSVALVYGEVNWIGSLRPRETKIIKAFVRISTIPTEVIGRGVTYYSIMQLEKILLNPPFSILAVTKSGTGSGTVTSTPAGIDCGTRCSNAYPKTSVMWGWIPYDTLVTLTATPSSTSIFSHWSGDCNGTSPLANVTMNGDKTCMATFDPIVVQNFTLAVTKAGNGGGVITGAGRYNYNTAVTVTATANTGSAFAGWTGTNAAECTAGSVVMTADKSCTATFNQQGFTLSMIKSGLGTGVVTSSPSGINCGTACSAVFPIGASVMLTAVPSSGSVFVRWGGICSGITSSISVTMNANKICYAVFNQNFTLTVAKLGHAEGNTWVYGSGTITSTPAGINCGVTCSASFSGGTSVTLTAVPDAGFVFVQWGGSCSGTALMTNILVDTNKICYATFNPSTLVFTLNVIKSGNGGGAVTSSPSGINCGATCSTPFSSGTRVMLMAVPNSGSIFSGWSGACSGTDSSANVAMNANKTCTATFNLITYKLTLGIAGTGQGVVSGDGTYLVGAKVTLGATPNAGSIFAGWSGNADCTDGLVTMNENKTCRATFNIEVGIGGGHKAYWEEYLASYPGASNIQRTPEVFLGGNLLSDGLGRRTGYYTPEGMIRGEGWFKDPVSWTDKLDPIDGVPNTGRCRIEVYHPRRHIGTLRPGHNGGVGLGTNLAVGNVTPKYFTSGLFGSATFVWYLDTGQLTDANVTYGSCTSKKVRKVVWPGEVTDDGWAVIPTSADPNTAKFIFVVPANVDPNTVTIRDIGYGTVIPLPYYKGGIPFIGPNITTRCPFDECYSVVLGGGGGPNLGTDIVNSEGRAKYEWVGDTIRIYITGMGTGGNLGNDSGYLKQLSDGFSDPVAHAVLAFIRDLNISRGPNIKIELYGHSLGAAEATWVYQNGGLRYGDKVFSLGTPFFVNGGDMQSGINGVEYKAYCETLDSICTGSLSTPVTKGRWVNETIIYGAGYRNPHARKLYISILGLPDF